MPNITTNHAITYTNVTLSLGRAVIRLLVLLSYAQAKSSSIDSRQNGTYADYHEKTNSVVHDLSYPLPHPPPPLLRPYQPEWNVLLTLNCHFRTPFIRIFAILGQLRTVKPEHQLTMTWLGRDEVWDRETMLSQLAKRSPCVVVSG